VASYDKVKIVPTEFTGPGTSYHMPPEVMVCIECGCMVWPTRVQLHDAWHVKIAALSKKDLSYGTIQRRQGQHR
jgi:hypothetical protein